MIDGLLQVNRISTREEMTAVEQAATADNHWPLCPTHYVKRNGVIVGSISACSIPLVTAWVKKDLGMRSSLELINIARIIGRERNGGQPVVTLSPKSTPLHKYMERIGFKTFADTTIFLEDQ